MSAASDPAPVAAPSSGAFGLMMAAMAAFALQDAAVKAISADVSIWQMKLVRSVLVLALVAVAFGLFRSAGGLKLVNPGWAALRAVLMSCAFLLYYLSLPLLSLAEAAACFFTGPLFITLLAALFLGEPVGWRRVCALAMGFAGVLVMVRPGLDGFQPASLLPVGAAFCYALGVLVTRARCVEDSAAGLSMVHNIVLAQVGLAGVALAPAIWPGGGAGGYPFLMESWLTPPLWVWGLMLLTAASHLIGAVAITRAYQRAQASAVAPLEYVYLAMIAAIDLAIWGVLPDSRTVLGVALIAGAGGFIAWREGRAVRPRPQTHGEEPWVPEQR